MIAIGEAPQLLTEFGMQQIAPAVFSTVEVEPRLVEDWTHLNKAVALYDRAEHSPLATRFGQDVGVVILSWRSWTAWVLGYPEAAVADVKLAVKNAREIGHAPTLIYALFFASSTHAFCGNYATAGELSYELVALAGEKGASFWEAQAMSHLGCLLAPTGEAADAVHMITSALSTYHSTGATVHALVLVDVDEGLCETRTV
jgi:hypothetical protein